MKLLLRALVLVFLCAIATFLIAQAPERRIFDLRPQNDFDDRYIVVFRQFGPHAAPTIRAVGGRVALELREYRALAAYLRPEAVSALLRNPTVQRVEPDPRRYPMAQDVPYGITMVQADQVSDTNAGNMKVCIIDSGYYLDHEDLPKTTVTGDSDPSAGEWFKDGFGHGTHVAGTVAALNNGVGVVGVLPSGTVNLHIVRVFNDAGTWAYSSTLVNALTKCRNAGAKVVSMSLGGTGSNLTEQSAFDDAYNAGVLSVAAAGNAGNTQFSYPASYSSVVSVAAIDRNQQVAAFSQKNSQVELAAPGVGVLSTVPYIDNSTLTVGGNTYHGNPLLNAAFGSGTGALADGGLCNSTGAWAGKVVLCERGSISFFDKVRNVQNSGGVGVAIYNNVSGNFTGTLGDGNTSTIPAISLSREDGQAAKAFVGQSATVSNQPPTKPASGYEEWDGTSMATPHVSGVAALVWSNFPTCTNAQVRNALQATALDLGAAGRDTSYGFGLVRAKAAFDYLTTNGCPAPPPPPPPPPPGTNCTYPGDGLNDEFSPIICDVKGFKTNKGGNFAITWTTDRPADSMIWFTCCGIFSDPALVTSHRMDFRGKKGVTYEYHVFATDANGFAGASGPHYFKN
jgi:subtilisin family serine protease